MCNEGVQIRNKICPSIKCENPLFEVKKCNIDLIENCSSVYGSKKLNISFACVLKVKNDILGSLRNNCAIFNSFSLENGTDNFLVKLLKQNSDPKSASFIIENSKLHVSHSIEISIFWPQKYNTSEQNFCLKMFTKNNYDKIRILNNNRIQLNNNNFDVNQKGIFLLSFIIKLKCCKNLAMFMNCVEIYTVKPRFKVHAYKRTARCSNR